MKTVNKRTSLVAIFLIMMGFSIAQRNIQSCSTPGHVRTITGQFSKVGPCSTASVIGVQICHDDKWKAICIESSTTENAKVLCRASGYSTIGATITAYKKMIGPEIGSLVLNCTGFETKIEDCLKESIHSNISHCQGIAITCFLGNPDPQLCNISLPTTTPRENETPPRDDETTAAPSERTKSTGSPTTELTKNNNQLQTSTLSDTLTTAAHGESSNSALEYLKVTGILVAVLVLGDAGIVVVLIACLSLKHRKNEKSQLHQREKPKQQQNDFADYAEISDCRHPSQTAKDMDTYQCTTNDAYSKGQNYGTKLCAETRLCYFDMSAESVMANSQQQSGEPVYEEILYSED